VDMTVKWEKKTLYELADWKNGLAFRDINFTVHGKPIIKIAELKNGITGQTKYTLDEFDPSVALTKGDLLFSWSGNPETSIDVFYYDLQDGWLNQHIFKVTPRRIEKGFLYYLLKYYKSSFSAIASNKQTTGLGHVTVQDLKNLIVSVPPQNEQLKINRVLESLDNRIYINNKINHNLEAIGQTGFMSFFIDFEPFGRKLPSNWREGTLKDIFKFRAERISVSQLDVNNYISTDNMLQNKAGVVPASNLPTVPNAVYFNPGDTLISNIRPYFKKILYCTFFGGCSPDVLCFQPKEPNLSLFLYNILFNDTFFDYIVSGSKGTKMPRGDKQHIIDFPILIPNSSALNAFNELVSPIMKQITLNIAESTHLNCLRDTLLPHLMSGDLSVGHTR
jgi:type I restriction enzyme S subunit